MNIRPHCDSFAPFLYQLSGAYAPFLDVMSSFTFDEIQAIYDLPFSELLFRAQWIHREHHNPNVAELLTHPFSQRLTHQDSDDEPDLRIAAQIDWGENASDRADSIWRIARMHTHPELVCIHTANDAPDQLVMKSVPIDSFELVRTIATARIAIPCAELRIVARHTKLSDELQALCLLAGANRIALPTAPEKARSPRSETHLLKRLGLVPDESL